MADTLYKQLFSHPEIVRDLVAGFLPADWARALTVAAFERVNASYTSDGSRARQQDVVWRARIGGDWVYVYILLEFQSRADRWMALRMQVYIGLLYQDLVAQHKLSRHGKLPPVLPIVLYHGRRPWRAATTLAELLLSPPGGLEHFQPQQRYLLIDRHHGDERNNIVALLFRMLRARGEAEMLAAARTLMERVSQRDLAPARASLEHWLRFTLQDEFENTNMDLEEVLAMKPVKHKLGELLPPDFFTDMLKTNQQAMQQAIEEERQRSMQEGTLKGMQQGMEEGLQQGERLALQGMLNDLLATAATEVDGRIAEADNAQLRAWIKALFEGASPRQLFAGG